MLDLQSEEEVRCCLSGAKLVLMKNGVMVVLSVKLCTFFVEFVCVFPWKCVSLNNQNRGKIMDGILRKLPIGIQTFEKLREGDYLYVDKTALVWRIASTETPYFLSRPRRFGKSLLLSTFEAYFEGKKELFEGLAIADMEKEWKTYPVFHLDLNAEKYDSPQALVEILSRQLTQWELKYGKGEDEELFRDVLQV